MAARKFSFILVLVMSFTVALASSGMDTGKPDIKQAGMLTFSPEGVLFVGDSPSAAVFAIDVQDKTMAPSTSEPLSVNGIDTKIAALLGTTPDMIRINDMAVHPRSKNVYLSISRGRGADAMPVILKLDSQGEISEFSLNQVSFSKAMIGNAPAQDAKDRRGRPLRTQSITDLAFHNGELLVAGLSNEEFASSLRRIPFPFQSKKGASSSLEIFHVAHGQYETHAPIRTFLPFTLNNQPHLIASYTCTPLVVFPLQELDDGKHVKGKTVAELGAGNQPLDIVSVKAGEKDYILLANSNRTMMKIDPSDIVAAQSLTQPLTERYGTSGIDFVNLPRTGVLQLSEYNDSHFIMIQRDAQSGSLNLRSYPKRRL